MSHDAPSHKPASHVSKGSEGSYPWVETIAGTVIMGVFGVLLGGAIFGGRGHW